MRKILIGTGGFSLVLGILITSFVIVPTQMTGHLTKKYGKPLDGNRVIAINGERGRQADLLQEGLNFKPFVRVVYSIDYVNYEKIDEGQVGLLTAVDGSPMGKDLYIAPDWVTNESDRDSIERNMLDPRYFIEHGGKKGPQLNLLKPGEYKINKFMWKVDIVDATRIPDGHVGVIISRIGKVPENIELEADSNNLATPVVDKGYMGIWKDVLKPGMYYLNRHPDANKGAYEVKVVDTRIQTWAYKGGYDYYTIDLTVGEDGKIKQEKSKTETMKTPQSAADNAIRAITMDEWPVFVDGRILVQVQPNDAPYIIASVGGLTELEDRITTPLIRSVIRNEAESRTAIEFVKKRSDIELNIDKVLKESSNGSRLTIKEFKMNNVYLKPELLIPGKRKQLAEKLKDTYKQEKLAYDEKKHVKKLNNKVN